ncbi:EAL domain-containing protein [Geminicoccaceae bacterium 1502E]|nr:EAL domain-containing protein [Geminicoccaceae bacterium 1502E]
MVARLLLVNIMKTIERERPAQEPRPLCYVVDDEKGILSFVELALSGMGFEVRCFDDLPAIEAGLGQELPRLVIMDISLAGADAVDLLRRLAALRYDGAVLLISGLDEATIEQVGSVGRRLGLAMLPHLRKPFRGGELRERLVEHVGLGSTLGPPDLDQALEEGRLEMWYQPKIGLRERRVLGCEALLRLRHPFFGVLGPDSFLRGVGGERMRRVTLAVLDRVEADLEAWPDLFSSIAINMPASSFVDGAVCERLCEVARRQGAGRLVVEMTEDELMSDVESIFLAATKARIYGVELSIDDFGTGFTSLALLREIPFAELKIDRCFVKGCAVVPKERTIVKAIVDLAHNLSARAVGEGIENVEDLEALSGLGCDVGQGFFFARPQPPAGYAGFVRDF